MALSLIVKELCTVHTSPWRDQGWVGFFVDGYALPTSRTLLMRRCALVLEIRYNKSR